MMRGKYKNNVFFVLAAILFWITSLSFAEELNYRSIDSGSSICNRIVSLAPSITETLYELGLGRSVVGVSKFDSYPEDVKNKVIIGGFLDPNLEEVFKLKPTIVIGLTEHGPILNNLNSLNIKTHTIDHRSVNKILESFEDISKLCGIGSVGKIASSKIETLLNEQKQLLKNQPIKKVAIVVSRNYESSELKEVYLSGLDGYYDTLLSYAQASNVFSKESGSVNAVSIEGIFALDPDVIIEVLPAGYISKYSQDHLSKPWKALKLLRAVNQNNLYFIDEDWATIPGPRMTNILRYFMQVIHPGIQK